jgi:anti-anti-sigma regulatory factor
MARAAAPENSFLLEAALAVLSCSPDDHPSIRERTPKISTFECRELEGLHMTSERRWSAAGLPVVRPDEQAGLKDFWEMSEAHHDEMYQALMRMVTGLPRLASALKRMTPAQLDEQNRTSRLLMRRALLENEWAPLVESQRQQGAFYASQGVTFLEWFEVVGTFQQILVPHLVKEFSKTPERLSSAILGMACYLDIAMSVIGDAYLKTKEKIISEQQHAIQELSTPVLRVRDRILLLPMVGVVDTQRARLLTEQLLHAIRAHRSKIVVIDVTGVPAVDSKVANHLFQTVAAARLMGATSVVTGLSAAVSQALVTLGVDLSGVNTVGDLQEGLEEAERLLGYRVVRAEVPSLLGQA